MDTWSMHNQEFVPAGLTSQIASVVESQKQMLVMFKDVSQRINTLESTVAGFKSSSVSSSSPEEKKRVPYQLTNYYFLLIIIIQLI